MASGEDQCRHFVISIVILSILLLSSTSSLMGTGIGDPDDAYDINDILPGRDPNYVSQPRSTDRAAVDIKPMMGLYSCPPGGDLSFNFTVEELNGVNLTMNSALFELHSYDRSAVHEILTDYDLNIDVPGGSVAAGQSSVNIPSDLYIKTSRIGDDGVYVKVDIAGIDEHGNAINAVVWFRAAVTMKVAVLVQDNIESIVRSNLDRYYSDVRVKNDVDFIERSKNWETPESVREELISLWENESITGAILVGDLPYAIWEINHTDGSKEPCPIPIFYEDLDGDFKDNNSNGSYDLHFWGENDGPEIWVSFLSPPSETIPASHLRTGGTGSASGLTGKYYSDNNFQTQVLTRVDREIEFYWEDSDPPSPVPDDSFSILWEGQVNIDRAESYAFEVIHGGGMAFEIDGVEYLRDDTCPPWHRKMKNLDIDLTAGWHEIKLSYMENGWGGYKGQIRLCWRSNATVGRIINEWFDKDHTYHNGEMGAPERGLLFMDYAYGGQCSMLQPIRENHMEPLFGEHLDVGGGQNTTNATEYLEFLDLGHELTSIWTHAGGGGHQFGVPPDSGAEYTAAESHEIKETKGSLVTLIWGCHAGDFANTGYSGSVTKTENLVVNYAFNTEFGLASMGCTRSYGTTFDRVYHDLKEGSYLGLGYFHFKDVGYDKEMRMSETHPLGEKMWIEDEVMFGDPFIRIHHFPDNPAVKIENGSRFASGDNISITIESSGAEEMRITYENGNTGWIEFEGSPILDIETIEGILDVIVETRNGYGQAAMEASDRILIENTPPAIKLFMINGGETATNDSSVLLEMDLSDDLSGLDSMCFSNNGINWSEWEDTKDAKSWDLEEGEGEKTVHIKVMDIAGNVITTSASIIFDSIGPKIWIDLLGNIGNNSWYNSDVEFSFYTLDEDLSSIWFSIRDDEWILYENPMTLTTDGVHTIEYYSTDDLGNIGSMENTTIKMDQTPPENLSLRIEDDVEYTNNSIVNLLVEGGDALSGIDDMCFKIDSGDWGPWLAFNSSYILNVGGVDNVKKIEFRIRDLAGNIRTMGDPLFVVLDTQAPSILDTIPRNGETVSRNMPVSFSFNEEIDPDSVDVRVTDQNGDDVSFEWLYTLSIGLEIRPIMDGYMTCTIIISGNLSDLAGNRIGDPATLVFKVTGIPPGSPENLTASTSDVTVSLSWNTPQDIGDLPVTGYNIYRIGVGSDWTLIGNTDEEYFVDSTVDPGSTYRYRVAAFNEYEEGMHSTEVSVKTPDPVIDDDTDDDEVEDNGDNELNDMYIVIGIVLVLAIPLVFIIYLLIIRNKEIPPEE